MNVHHAHILAVDDDDRILLDVLDVMPLKPPFIKLRVRDLIATDRARCFKEKDQPVLLSLVCTLADDRDHANLVGTKHD